jgi:hypothetical protein
MGMKTHTHAFYHKIALNVWAPPQPSKPPTHGGTALASLAIALEPREVIMRSKKLIPTILTLTLTVGVIGLYGCSQESGSSRRNTKVQQAASTGQTTDMSIQTTSSSAVEGTVRGTTVTLAHAKFDGQLAIYEGDGWGFSPSLLIFLFLDDQRVPENKTFVVDDGAELGGTPHVHYRWKDERSGDIESEAVMDGYEMSLSFGKVSNGHVPGTIKFTVPGEDTRVEGTFLAKIDS